MHVCVLSDGYPPWDRGGAQTIAAQVAAGYRTRGHAVSVVTTVPDAGDAGRSTVEGVTVYRLHAPRIEPLLGYLTVYNPFVVRACRRLLDRLDPDAVHAHNTHWLSNRVVALAGADRPLVKTFHDAGTVSYGELTHFVDATPSRGTPAVPRSAYAVDPRRQAAEHGLRYNPVRNRHNRRCLDRHVDVAVAVSRELRRALEANGVPCHRTIHNGVDPDAFGGGCGAAAFRRRHGLGDARLIVFGGRTGYNKGGHHLAAAFGRLVEAVDEPVRLVVTGDDGYVPAMRRAAAPHGDRIVATGWLPQATLYGAFAAATVVASPSVHLDPFPTVNLEAFAAGTPVVTSCFGGASELVDHGVDGLVVNPLDVPALAAALRRLVDDPETAADWGRAGRRKVGDRFTVDEQVDEYLDIFRALRGR